MLQDFLFPQRDQPLLPADMREWLPEDDPVFVVLDAAAQPGDRERCVPDVACRVITGGLYPVHAAIALLRARHEHPLAGTCRQQLTEAGLRPALRTLLAGPDKLDCLRRWPKTPARPGGRPPNTPGTSIRPPSAPGSAWPIPAAGRTTCNLRTLTGTASRDDDQGVVASAAIMAFPRKRFVHVFTSRFRGIRISASVATSAPTL